MTIENANGAEVSADAPPVILSGPELLAQIAELREQLASARNQQVAEREAWQHQLRDAHDCHRADIELIGKKLLRESERRDWCNEFDDFVDDLNGSLRYDLPTRYSDYSVGIEVTIYVSVSAISEDDAREKAYEIAQDLEGRVDRMDGVVNSAWPHVSDYDVSEDS